MILGYNYSVQGRLLEEGDTVSANRLDKADLDSIFHECHQCGLCCKRYRRIQLQSDEVEFIKKMGGFVGVDIRLDELRGRSLAEVEAEVRAVGRIYMIHPDDRGCVFLQKYNGKYICRIYHHRPRACRGFKCNFADRSFFDLIGGDAMALLGRNRFGMPLK